MRGRRVGFGLATVLGLARRGFFIPYRYAGDLPPAGTRPPYGAAAALLCRHEHDFRAAVSRLDDDARALRAIGRAPPPAPRWDQDWFPRLDAAMAYSLVRHGAPRRLVEIGSGHSTRFLACAVNDAGHGTRMTAIDPAPRASLAGLDVELVRAPLHEIDDAPFAEFVAGDVLFIDSSHILMPATDVDRLLNHVLPSLPAGVRVHFHDIFLPDDYPAEWAWRGYNEQIGVAALLQGGGWRPLFASHYVATRMAEVLREGVIAELPLVPGARESSLWIEKL